MTPTNQVQKTLGEQMADLLRRKPKNFDVVFSVGPDKIKVEAVKFVLKAASPVFETEFDEKWENGVVTDDNGIPLPDLDPTAFQLFINLLILDAWSLDSIKSLKLSPNNLLNLLGLCRQYKITKAIRSLEEAAEEFIQNFYKLKDSPEFLKMTRENLETIFSCNQLPLDEKEVFDSACRWAEHQCQEKNLEPTGENFRHVLGSAFFEIRFPTMKGNFGKVSNFKKNLLTPDERLAICEFIILDEDDRANYDTTQLTFKTNPRNTTGCSSVLRLFEHFKFTADPLFVCNGGVQEFWLQVNQKIALHSVGFLGPIGGDTQYDATLKIGRRVKGSNTFVSSIFKKQIVARKDQSFHFLLEEPITIEPNAFDSSWKSFYWIDYSLKGANNIPQYTGEYSAETSIQISGVQLNLKYFNGSPLTELLFKIQ